MAHKKSSRFDRQALSILESPVSVKKKILGRKTHIGREAFGAPDQGLDSSFC